MEQREERKSAAVGRVQLYTWLGAGAVTFGVGAALAVGSGIAQADSTTPGNRSASSAADGATVRTPGPTRLHANTSHVRSAIVESQLTSSGNPTPPAASTSTNLPDGSREFSASSLMPPTSELRSASTHDPSGRQTNNRSVADVIAKASSSPGRGIESRSNALVGALPPVSPAAAAQNTGAVPTTATLREASAASAITPKDNIDIAFSGFNGSIGWIPVVGTAINGVKFAIDSFSLAASVITLDLPQAITELGNLVVDLIGLVPVVGGPVASLLSQTVLGVNVKLGSLVQESLQNFLAGDSTYSRYQFNVDAVDVSIGLGGSQAGTATVSKPSYSGVPVIVDVTNTGFEFGWSVPLEGRLQLLRLAFL